MLVVACEGAEAQLQEKLLGCMSTRAAANIRDEMEALGPVRLTEVQEAQKQIINVARKLSDDGTIVLAGRGGGGLNKDEVIARQNEHVDDAEDPVDIKSLLAVANSNMFDESGRY